MNEGASTSFAPDLGPPPGPDQDKRCRKCSEINTKKLIYCTHCRCPYHKSCVNIKGKQASRIPIYACAGCRGTTTHVREPANGTNHGVLDFDLTQHLKACKANLSLISNIPRGARITAANALSDLMNEAVQSNSSLSWSKLLCFSYHGLQKPTREKLPSKGPSLVSKIKNQIGAFVSSDFPPDRFPFQVRSGKAKPKPKEEILRNRVDAKFAEFDFRGAIRELSSEDSLAPDNEATFAQLRERHPPAPAGISFPSAPTIGDAHTQASVNSVKKAILSFPAGSAGGPDGLKPGHLKNLIGAPEAGNRLLESLTNLVNFVLKEKIPENIRPIFFGANLFALEKKDGGVRPIAVGLTLRRLTTKVGLKPVSHELGEYFEPSQVGYSSRAGSEAAAHAARHYITSDTQNKVFLKLDIKMPSIA